MLGLGWLPLEGSCPFRVFCIAFHFRMSASRSRHPHPAHLTVSAESTPQDLRRQRRQRPRPEKSKASHEGPSLQTVDQAGHTGPAPSGLSSFGVKRICGFPLGRSGTAAPFSNSLSGLLSWDSREAEAGWAALGEALVGGWQGESIWAKGSRRTAAAIALGKAERASRSGSGCQGCQLERAGPGLTPVPPRDILRVRWAQRPPRVGESHHLLWEAVVPCELDSSIASSPPPPQPPKELADGPSSLPFSGLVFQEDVIAG